MCDSHHKYDKRVFQHFIDDPVVTYAQSAEPAVRSFQWLPDQWSLGQAVDGVYDAKPVLFWTRVSSLAALRLIRTE